MGFDAAKRSPMFVVVKGNIIHETAVIEDTAVLKEGGRNLVGPFAHLSNCHIGSDNTIGTGVVIGAAPEIYEDESGFHPVVIGDRNSFREYVTVHMGSKRKTEIGSNNLFMVKSHVAHDTIIGDRNKIGGSVFLGGHCFVGNHVFIGGGSLIHQFVCIASYAMIGMGAAVNRHVKAGQLLVGPGAQFAGMNERILKQRSICQNLLDIENQRMTSMIERRDPRDGTVSTTKVYE